MNNPISSEIVLGQPEMCNLPVPKEVRILYTNWRGETMWRRIIPKGIRFAVTSWHPDEQWLLDAFDVDKQADHSFALSGVKQWGDEVQDVNLESVTKERDKLQKFKDWVHAYLDAHGVPHHPPGTNGVAGCRIGDRMDWLMEQISDQQDWFADVLEFHRKLAPSIIRPMPCVPEHRGGGQYCLGFMQEEMKELTEAMWNGDVPKVADGLVDLIVVTIRASLIWGIDLRPLWDEVHRANMAKEGGETREDSKVLKPAGWTPPDVAGVLRMQKPLA